MYNVFAECVGWWMTCWLCGRSRQIIMPSLVHPIRWALPLDRVWQLMVFIWNDKCHKEYEFWEPQQTNIGFVCISEKMESAVPGKLFNSIKVLHGTINHIWLNKIYNFAIFNYDFEGSLTMQAFWVDQDQTIY